MLRNPIENSIGVSNVIEPPIIVKIQLKIFTPVGTAMIMVASTKNASRSGGSPVVNMWCAHDEKPSTPMAMVDHTIAR